MTATHARPCGVAPRSRVPRLRLVLVLAALTMVGPFTIDAIFPAFEVMTRELAVDKVAMQQTMSVYLVAFAVASLFHGSLSDALGRRPVILMGCAAVCRHQCPLRVGAEHAAPARRPRRAGPRGGRRHDRRAHGGARPLRRCAGAALHEPHLDDLRHRAGARPDRRRLDPRVGVVAHDLLGARGLRRGPRRADPDVAARDAPGRRARARSSRGRSSRRSPRQRRRRRCCA